jgi:hypothetical protein
MIEKNIPSEVIQELYSISHLHEQAVSNHDKCREFSESLSELLVRLEDMKFYRTADRLMSVLLNCKPKEASHCEKATIVETMIKEVTKDVKKKAGN